MSAADDTYLTGDADKARSLLSHAPVAYLAVVETGGPYVVPVNFAYLPGMNGSGNDPGGRPATPDRIIFHSGPGRKTAALETDARVCLAIAADVGFQAGPGPCEDGFAYRSAVVEGWAHRLTGQDEREAGLRAIVKKYDPAAADLPFAHEDLAQTLVYAVDMEAVSYKERPRER